MSSDGNALFDTAPTLDAPLAEPKELTATFGMQPKLSGRHKLGEGGMGAVFAARQSLEARNVAIKEVHDRGDSSADALVAEARIMAQLEHPGIPTLYRIELDRENVPSLVMQKIVGKDWSQSGTWHEASTESQVERIRVLEEVCRVIEYAHANLIIHRDLKPTNVMVGDEGRVFVIDWGIAIFADEGDEQMSPCGTPAYMAPEMLGQGFAQPSVDTRSDVYLLGAILFHIMTGAPPHVSREGDERAWYQRISDNKLAFGDCDDALRDMLRKALASDKAKRYQSVSAFRADLKDYRLWLSNKEIFDEIDHLSTKLLHREREAKSRRKRADLIRDCVVLLRLESFAPPTRRMNFVSAERDLVRRVLEAALEENRAQDASEMLSYLPVADFDDLRKRISSQLDELGDLRNVNARYTSWRESTGGALTLVLVVQLVAGFFWVRQLWRYINDIYLPIERQVTNVTAGTMIALVAYIVARRYRITGALRLVLPNFVVGMIAVSLMKYSLRSHEISTITTELCLIDVTTLGLVFFASSMGRADRGLRFASFVCALAALAAMMGVDGRLVESLCYALSALVISLSIYFSRRRQSSVLLPS